MGLPLEPQGWMDTHLGKGPDHTLNMKQFQEPMEEGNEGVGGEDGKKGPDSDPFHWENEDSQGSRDSSVFQNSVDESSNSQDQRSLFTTPLTSPGGGVRKERLIIKFRRISEKYYMVEETKDSSCLNYKSIRHKFEEYDLSDLFDTPKKNNNPKVHRCKTCRKVFSKASNLATHRKTHATAGGFDRSRSKGFTALDFAKRFSDAKVSFDPNLITPSQYEEILAKVSPHPTTYPGYVSIRESGMPYIKPGGKLVIGDESFLVSEVIGEGGFARVFSAAWETGPPNERDSVLKVQMPANDWEWYCLNQVHSRFAVSSHPLKEEKTLWDGGFMATPRCFTYRDGSILVTAHQRMGTLLDLVNLTKNADKCIIEPIAIYLTAELLGLIEIIHSLRIVHADIKPDNFLLRHTPSTRPESSLQLIDFGKAIDLDLEENQDLPQVEGRQGKYHLDYFGIAGSAYCLLFGKYIEVSTVKNKWVVKDNFKRWWQVKLWTQFFDDMLNPKTEEKKFLPSLLNWRTRLLKLFEENDELKTGLKRAVETIDMKYMEKWRRCSL